MTQAFWLSPEGDIHEVNRTHIYFVTSNPEVFDFDTEWYQKLLDEYDEKPGQEGKARRVALTEIVKKGWIRIRFRSKGYKYSVETWEFNKQALNNVKDWAIEAQEKGDIYQHPDLEFIETGNSKKWKKDLEEFLSEFQATDS